MASESPEPCKCCEFPKNILDYSSRIPRWSEKAKSNCGAHLAYLPELPGLPTSADWLELPNRDTLIQLRRFVTRREDRERLRACLNPLRFDPTTGLGRVHEWIHRYLFYEKQHGWYHVSVSLGRMKSFLEAMSAVDVVVLPYGCVSDGGSYKIERICLKRHWRQMILVVKDDHPSFERALETIRFGNEPPSDNISLKLSNAKQLIETIAFVSRQEFQKGWPLCTRNYIVFEPMIQHAFWWMLLLIPHDYEKDHFSTPSSSMEIQNCVVLFDPLNQCIGDAVERIGEEDPFVYGFDKDILKVEKIEDVAHHDKQSFVNWCMSKGKNTLLNLNGNGWSQPTFLFQCNDTELSFSSGDENSSDDHTLSDYRSEDSMPEVMENITLGILDDGEEDYFYNMNVWDS